MIDSYILAIFGLVVSVYFCLKRGGVYEFPFFVGLVYTFFFFPQVIALSIRSTIDTVMIQQLVYFALACGLASIIGYYAGSRSPIRTKGYKYREDRLRMSIYITALIGFVGFALIASLPVEQSFSLSGRRVMFLFFADVLPYAFVLATFTYLKVNNRIYFIILISTGLFIFYNMIFIGGKRSDMAFMALAVCTLVWFVNDYVVPRYLVISFCLLAVVFSFSISEYRFISRDNSAPKFSEIREIKFMDNLRSGLVESGGTEIEAAIYQIEGIRLSGSYDYGLFHWNRFIFNYIPAQIVGSKFKESLYWKNNDGMTLINAIDYNELTGASLGYYKTPGLTSTGFVDAFSSFWYFGFIKFYIMGFIVGKIYVSAIQGSVLCQVLYPIVIVPSISSFTHNTHWFYAIGPHVTIFIISLMLWSRDVASKSDFASSRNYTRVGI